MNTGHKGLSIAYLSIFGPYFKQLLKNWTFVSCICSIGSTVCLKSVRTVYCEGHVARWLWIAWKGIETVRTLLGQSVPMAQHSMEKCPAFRSRHENLTLPNQSHFYHLFHQCIWLNLWGNFYICVYILL